MKRAALVAGVSFAALLMAGSAKLQAAQNPGTGWATSRAITTSSPLGWRSFKARSRPSEKAQGKAGRAADKSPPIPSGPLHIIVSIDKQRATLFADGQPVASTAISSGTHDHPTPMGVFTVIQKDRHHISNLYDASMPYMQRITWSGSALHQGPLPGYPASHGCVRLTESFAQLLWKTTKMGARVIVTRPEVAPLEFAHARLFVPKPRMVSAPPAIVPPAVAPAPAATPVVAAEPATTSSVTKVRTAANSPAVTIASVVGDATKAVTTAVVTEPVASTAVEQPTKQTDTDGVGGTRGPADVKTVEMQPLAAKPDETPSAEAKSADVRPVEAKSVEAKPVDAHSTPITAPAPITIDERPKTMPAAIVQEANGRPISVFVSLKENKLYVRQGWKPLFDAPVSFEHPEQPIGTHVYTAMGAKAEGGLRWTVVSIPSSFRRAAEAKNETKNSVSGRKGRREHAAKAVEVVAPMPNPSPSAALDRIVMPPELVDRIAELITPGSSLIVSDNRLSDETGEYTDFIVLTR
jgi:lipoprotein-anchoring transpeptidase ErfK/SrfK